MRDFEHIYRVLFRDNIRKYTGDYDVYHSYILKKAVREYELQKLKRRVPNDKSRV